jgi:TRAP-type C4-dicarboxylate transport system substrate-binding protein
VTTKGRPISAPEDLQGLALRVPHSPVIAAMFEALGAKTMSMNFNDLAAALRGGLVDGQENALSIIATAGLHNLQRFCALTRHVWDGYWIIANPGAFRQLPGNFQEIVRREFDRAVNEQRAENEALNESLRSFLASNGVLFNEVDRPAFKSALARTGFYGQWRKVFGQRAWEVLESYVGPIG